MYIGSNLKRLPRMSNPLVDASRVLYKPGLLRLQKKREAVRKETTMRDKD